ncbi:hypothetical protein MUN84_12815 [Hymenobacter sp. 5516J-16]|uniref:hypothetical protein n=1 Tax=Hymenobacter sp. 5516J-16 TaxID=2932253 RepID=UPI001FD05D9A|nr:hypothetical protein [Hymenobacter sp. 5516J-16]UOQ75570.1 hypothetical protein MUN84_12815 [Hymenobacter sp. 5516J-16]
MKTHVLRTLGVTAVVGAALLSAACTKNADPQAATEVTVSAEDQSLAEDENATVADLVEAGSPTDVSVTGSPRPSPPT